MGISGVGSGSSNVNTNNDSSGAEAAARKAAEEARAAAEAAARDAAAKAARKADTFQAPPRRNTVALDGGGANQAQTPSALPSFRMGFGGVMRANSETARTPDEQSKQYIESQFEEKLGRPCGNAEEILNQAKASGASSQEDIQKFVDRTIDGSPEKSALNTVNGSFKELLGRELKPSEQQAWLKGSGINPAAPDFANQVRSTVMASEEYRTNHPAPPGTCSSTSEANQFMVTQWGGTSFNSANGAPYGYNDCGPTCGVMLASSFGLIPPPGPGGAEQAIDKMRDAALGYDTKYSQDTDETQIGHALQGLGAKTQSIGDDLASIDKAVGEGKKVLIAGDPWSAWGSNMNKQGDYLNHQDPGGHFVALMGKTPEGNYIVNDPLSKKGSIEVTPSQLKEFFRQGGNNSGALAVWTDQSRPASPPPSSPPATGGATAPTSTSTGAPRVQVAYDSGQSYSPDVAQVQQSLVKAGYLKAGDLAGGEGYYGDKTKAAVAQLQADYGITGDNGENYGPRSADALDQALKGQKPSSPPVSTGGTGGSGSTGGSAPIDPATLPKTGNAFLDKYAAQALEAQRKTGVPASITLAQAMLESGSGESSLAAKYNNFFGIKGTGTAGSVSLPTTEYDQNGVSHSVNQNFAVYNNPTESFTAHGQLIAGTNPNWTPYYAQPWAQYQKDHDAIGLARGIGHIYATDPSYAEKIVKIMQNYDLTRFDKLA